jgi:hypothetical protein
VGEALDFLVDALEQVGAHDLFLVYCPGNNS